MKQFPVYLAFFLAGAGVAAFAFWAFQPKATEDLSALEQAETKAKDGALGSAATSSSQPENVPASTDTHEKPAPSPQGNSVPSPASATGKRPIPDPTPLPNPGAGSTSTLPVVHGRVTYAGDGTGLGGIPVRVLREGKWHVEALTDKQGSFALGVPGPGKWRVAAFPYGNEGLQPGEDLNLVPGDSRYLTIVVPDRLTVDVSGTVTNDRGQPIADVKVQAHVPAARGRDRKETATSSSGTYSIQGLSIELEKPTPEGPREVGRFGGFHRGRGGFRRSSIYLGFRHPDYGQAGEHLKLAEHTDGKVTCDITMIRPGWVSGTVVPPAGMSLGRGHLTYSIVIGNVSSSGSGVRIDGNRFRIPIKIKGRLMLGDKLGKFRVVNPDLGLVDRTTRKEGVVVRLESMEYHEISLVDQQGRPLDPKVRVWASYERMGPGGYRANDLEVENGKLRIPVPLKEARVVSINGQGVQETRVKLEPGNLPATMTLKIMAPLMTGVVRFPAGFDDFRNVRMTVTAKMGSGGSSSTSGGFSDLDKKTGVFKIQRISGASTEDTLYTVVVTIPGYKTWKKANIKLKDGETLENVEITFKK